MDVSINMNKILECIWNISIHIVIHKYSNHIVIDISHIQYPISYT